MAMTTISMTADRTKRRWWHLADRIGATASLLCAVHCMALPFVLALLPLLGLGFLAGHEFERGFVLFAATLATLSLASGWRRHHQRLPLLLAIPGLVLLLAGISVGLEMDIVLHTVLVTCGGALVACAHLVNLRCSRLERSRAALVAGDAGPGDSSRMSPPA